MPYISQKARKNLETKPLSQIPGRFPGELTYMLSKLVIDYLGEHPSFSIYAEVLGALEATKLELYRRAIAIYEDKKIEENGDLNYPKV